MSLLSSSGNESKTPQAINAHWRVRFVWHQDGARQVEIVDYPQEPHMNDLLDEIHPGEVLLEDFMKPLAISARKLSADIDVSPSRISDLVHGQRPITADTALRLGIYFGMEPRFWLNLQSEYDMRIVARELQDKITPRIRVFQHVIAT